MRLTVEERPVMIHPKPGLYRIRWHIGRGSFVTECWPSQDLHREFSQICGCVVVEGKAFGSYHWGILRAWSAEERSFGLTQSLTTMHMIYHAAHTTRATSETSPSNSTTMHTTHQLANTPPEVELVGGSHSLATNKARVANKWQVK